MVIAAGASLAACGGNGDSTGTATVVTDDNGGGLIEIEPASEEGLSAEDLEFNKAQPWFSIRVISENRDVTAAEAARDYICGGKADDLAYSHFNFDMNADNAAMADLIERFDQEARDKYCP